MDEENLVYGGLTVGEDLFVVQRVRPGQYAFDPDSRAWKWDGFRKEICHVNWPDLLKKEGL